MKIVIRIEADMGTIIVIIGLLILLIAVVILVVFKYYQSPFIYPYKIITIDISNKRKVVYADYIKEYIKQKGLNEFKDHLKDVNSWKSKSETVINNSFFKKKRREQFLECIDDSNMFQFKFCRWQTRYKQVDYVKHPYKVFQPYEIISMSYNDIETIDGVIILEKLSKAFQSVKTQDNALRFGGWYWYSSSEKNKLNTKKCGKWMIFFSDQKFAREICLKAIQQKACYLCKCIDMETRKCKTGVICFYQNGDDIDNHKRIINFMIENNLIKRTKTGRYHNNSFKFDYQTRNKEYGDDYERKITLSMFIDLNSGEWIFENETIEL